MQQFLALGTLWTLFNVATTISLPKYTSSKTYFAQSDPNIPVSQVDDTNNFGLKSQYSWNDVVSNLASNEKLFFLQRHGQGWHNVAPSNFSRVDWNCYWAEQPGRDGVVWEDAELTPKGVQQIENLHQRIKDTPDFPQPEKFFVSPLRRTLQTWNITWNGLPHKTPLIKEFAREIYGIDSESKRHSKSFIQNYVPSFEFEPGFTEQDENWSPDKSESDQHCDYRAAVLLQDIFNDSPDEKVISIVLHSGIIYCLLDVVGHRYYPMSTGGAIPVVIAIKDSNTDYPLNDAWDTFKDWCPNPPASISGTATSTATGSA
ncbi:phosphomutase, putative [Candida dubliniensis CD36]|uniref:Phosphomutase, putative n=1 Tax=Candida dubliniensis (strain CD36 / ATCC MYA-646 / CBS 7987 / NCPF 3949 / NRRL Y-17841) TaxID=573826 RepID=B9WN21_CANDC|nr:phosphomutase, putative [Candida dubliniensis CD36]CAX40488.1 phosphomutase, putative [Candida dubliniensis CD36]